MLLLAEVESAAMAVTGNCYMVWIVAVLGAGALGGVFSKMQNGWGPQNLRAVGLVLVATFAALLAVEERGAVTSAFGLLGAIAGYLFGASDAGAKPTDVTDKE